MSLTLIPPGKITNKVDLDIRGGIVNESASQLKEMILRLEGGKNFIIRAEGLSEENKYVKAVFLNGKELKRFRIFHHEITDGGILEFIMTDNPSKSFN